MIMQGLLKDKEICAIFNRCVTSSVSVRMFFRVGSRHCVMAGRLWALSRKVRTVMDMGTVIRRGSLTGISLKEQFVKNSLSTHYSPVHVPAIV